MFRMNAQDLSAYVASRALTLATLLFTLANETQATLPPAEPVTPDPTLTTTSLPPVVTTTQASQTTRAPTLTATPPPFPGSSTTTQIPFPGVPATIVPGADKGDNDHHSLVFSPQSAGAGLAIGFAFGVTVTLSVAFCALQFSKRCRKANTNEEAQPLVRREMS